MGIQVDLYGRRELLPGAAIGNFGEASSVVSTLEEDFVFERCVEGKKSRWTERPPDLTAEIGSHPNMRFASPAAVCLDVVSRGELQNYEARLSLVISIYLSESGVHQGPKVGFPLALASLSTYSALSHSDSPVSRTINMSVSGGRCSSERLGAVEVSSKYHCDVS